MVNLTAAQMKQALQALSDALERARHAPTTLIVGGGGAMVLAHGYRLATTDIDAVPKGIEFGELDPLVKQVAAQLHLPTDWLNPYFSTFSHTLPPDYGDRLIPILETSALKVLALGAEDLLIMKCYAHRKKDVGHARALLRKKPNLQIVEDRIDVLLEKGIPGSQAALDFLQEVQELEGE